MVATASLRQQPAVDPSKALPLWCFASWTNGSAARMNSSGCLALPPRSTLNKYKEASGIRLSADLQERMSYLLNIHESPAAQQGCVQPG